MYQLKLPKSPDCTWITVNAPWTDTIIFFHLNVNHHVLIRLLQLFSVQMWSDNQRCISLLSVNRMCVASWKCSSPGHHHGNQWQELIILTVFTPSDTHFVLSSFSHRLEPQHWRQTVQFPSPLTGTKSETLRGWGTAEVAVKNEHQHVWLTE